MRHDPEVINFNGGEVSPLMLGRTDYPKYRSSAQLCENFIPSILGPLRRRPGTQYVGNPKYYDFNADGKRTLLVPFSASTSNEFLSSKSAAASAAAISDFGMRQPGCRSRTTAQPGRRSM